MNDFFGIIIVMLTFANVLGMLYASVEIELAYNINTCYSDLISVALTIFVFLTTSVLATICQSFNMIYLGLILPVSILVVNILVVRLANKKGYKRNVKPNVKIKL